MVPLFWWFYYSFIEHSNSQFITFQFVKFNLITDNLSTGWYDCFIHDSQHGHKQSKWLGYFILEWKEVTTHKQSWYCLVCRRYAQVVLILNALLLILIELLLLLRLLQYVFFSHSNIQTMTKMVHNYIIIGNCELKKKYHLWYVCVSL